MNRFSQKLNNRIKNEEQKQSFAGNSWKTFCPTFTCFMKMKPGGCVCGCGDMGSSAVLSKLQMLFVAFMGQIPSSWLLKHSPARCRVFLIFILFRGDRIHFFLKFILTLKDIVRWLQIKKTSQLKLHQNCLLCPFHWIS